MEFGIGYTFVEEARKGHHDLHRFSTAFEERRAELETTKAYCYDRFIEHSSNATGNVGSELDDLQRRYVWCTNHYLGLNRHPELVEQTAAAVRRYGTGSGTSAMSGGRCRLHVEIEDFLKDFLDKEDVVLFPTGYSTNTGMLSTLVQRNDVVISDAENHASIIDGIRLSGRDKLIFDHNNLDSLEARLREVKGRYQNVFVVVESAYSMSGDIAPLREIVALKRKYGFLLFVDEAHSFGFYGPRGRGLAAEMGLLREVDFLTGTFSKSCASIGGFCAFGKKFRTFITCRTSSYLFQAAIPPSAAATVLGALRLFSQDDSFAKDLHQKNAYMRGRLLAHGFSLGTSASPIIPIYISDTDLLTRFETDMYREGIFAVSVVYPAVKPDEGRIRLIINCSHSYADIDATVGILARLGRKYGVIAEPAPESLVVS